jgi:hypothetical protein
MAMAKADDTPRFEERLRNWACAGQGWHDAIDAKRVEQAWRRLSPFHKEMIRMVYLWHADREVVCRRLKIPRRPWRKYELELASAKLALASLLNASAE